MSVFEAGFIFWGFFVLYVLITLAYAGWAMAASRRERRQQAPSRRRDTTA